MKLINIFFFYHFSKMNFRLNLIHIRFLFFTNFSNFFLNNFYIKIFLNELSIFQEANKFSIF